jgi:hypothetical protein
MAYKHDCENKKNREQVQAKEQAFRALEESVQKNNQKIRDFLSESEAVIKKAAGDIKKLSPQEKRKLLDNAAQLDILNKENEGLMTKLNDLQAQPIIAVDPYLDQLTPYDLLAAENFKRDWAARNLKQGPERPEALQTVIDTITNVILQPYYWLNDQYDNILQYVLHATEQLVKECPKYFPPDDVTSVRNQRRFGAPNHDSQCLVSDHYAALFSQPQCPASGPSALPAYGATPLPALEHKLTRGA